MAVSGPEYPGAFHQGPKTETLFLTTLVAYFLPTPTHYGRLAKPLTETTARYRLVD
jgi:hypothetical protein